jgi:hypothetical protein
VWRFRWVGHCSAFHAAAPAAGTRYSPPRRSVSCGRSFFQLILDSAALALLTATAVHRTPSIIPFLAHILSCYQPHAARSPPRRPLPAPPSNTQVTAAELPDEDDDTAAANVLGIRFGAADIAKVRSLGSADVAIEMRQEKSEPLLRQLGYCVCSWFLLRRGRLVWHVPVGLHASPVSLDFSGAGAGARPRVLCRDSGFCGASGYRCSGARFGCSCALRWRSASSLITARAQLFYAADCGLCEWRM